MRLTCPNCGALYDVAAGMVPAEGRHVQCTACHTRWFEKPAARATLSEDEILSKLDRLAPGATGPRLVVAPPPPPPEVEVESLDEEEEEAEEEAAAAETPAAPVDPAVEEKPEAGGADAGGGAEVARLTPAAPRTAPRLALDRPVEAETVTPAAPRRFGLGFALALVLAGLALAAYRFADPLSAEIPAAKPALDGWEALVDGLRDRLAEDR